MQANEMLLHRKRESHEKKGKPMSTKQEKEKQKPYVILGGGVAGLATAWKLAEADIPVLVIESNAMIGGMAATFKYKEYLLDYGPHKIYSQLPIFEEVKAFLKDDILEVKKTSKIRLCDKYLNYPFGMKDLALTLSPFVALKCGMSYGTTSILSMVRKKEDTSYEDYLVNRFGRATYNLVFGPYAEKAWGNPAKLDKSLAASRVAIPSLIEMVKRMLFGDQGKKELSAATFFYPARGAVEMSQKMLEVIEKKGNKILLNTIPIRIEIKDKKSEAIIIKDKGKKESKEERIEVAGIVSTIPMQTFLELFPQVPEETAKTVDALKFRKLILLYIEANKQRLIPENWIFFPEKKYIFNRLSEQKGFSERMIPEDKTVLCVEMTFDQNDTRTKMSDKELYEIAIKELEACGIMKEEDTISYFTKHLKDGYPVYHCNYLEDVEKFLTFVEQYENVFSIGRQGMFNYVGTIDCIDMGATTAAFIAQGKEKEAWKQERKKFENYVTID